jgi:predicted RNase H-like HicB family nuclease
MKLKAFIHPSDEGGFWAEVPALPGCVSEGETYDETVANIREAAEGWLEVAAERSSSERDPKARVAEVEL